MPIIRVKALKRELKNNEKQQQQQQKRTFISLFRGGKNGYHNENLPDHKESYETELRFLNYTSRLTTVKRITKY